MPKLSRLKNGGTVTLLFQRELALTKSAYRITLKIIRDVVCSENNSYKNVWETKSKKPIVFIDRKLYFNNFQMCYSVCGRKHLPTFLYQLEDRKFGKIQSTLVYSRPVSEPCFENPASYKGFILVQTDLNWLCSYDVESGQLLQSVYFGTTSRYKFHHLDWDRCGETMTVMSNKNPSKEINANGRVLVAISWFSVLPLEFIALMEFDKEVFGKECVHCNVSEGILIVGTGSTLSGCIRLYDFYETINKGLAFNAKLGEPCASMDGSPCGSYPAGIPLNCRVKEAPPVLFQVQCSQYTLQFGCYPFHYITSLPKFPEIFQVCDVQNEELVKDGLIRIPNPTTTDDCRISFHGDDSGRIVHYTSKAVRFFKLVEEGQGNKRLLQSNIIYLGDSRLERVQSERSKSLSRNASKSMYIYDNSSLDRNFLADEYENEIDIYGVLGVTSHLGDNNMVLHLYDNFTEKKLRSIYVDMTYDEFSDYEVVLDLDTIMITEKTYKGQFKCVMYQIKSNSVSAEDWKKRGRRSSNKRKKQTKNI